MLSDMRLSAASGIALLALTIGASNALRAQDPDRDLPAERVAGITGKKALQLGVERLRTGWSWEAARMFRELMVLDEDKPAPHLLMALAFRHVPNRAARHCWDAVSRRQNADDATAPVLDAYQAYFAVDEQPELQDERYAREPDDARHDQLLAALSRLAADPFAANLLRIERERRKHEELRDVAQVQLELAAHNAHLRASGGLPFLVPGYRQTLQQALGEQSEPMLARIPRHPQHAATGVPIVALPGLDKKVAQRDTGLWQPRKATGFTLPRGVGGNTSFSQYEGKPVLVVFFLGFGCAHCVAQLADLDPKAPQFRKAGIEVVTIGTDDLNAVRAARQAAAENGVDPLHFDVLCDPKGEVFKQWGVWDHFSNEALHGTFLIDGKGRILWQDVSLRPFEESDWLLAESKRLLKGWADAPQ